MIEIKHKKKVIQIPDRWEELTPDQYLSVANLLFVFFENKSNLYDLKIELLKKLTNYKRSKKKFSIEDQETINDNLWLLADQLHFPVKPVYKNPELLEVLDPRLQEKLNERFPFEIYDPEFLPELEMVMYKLDYSPVINFNMKKNLLPAFEYNYITYQGPVFNIDSNMIVETDMITLEFIDAYTYFRLFVKNNDIKYLRNMVSVLYRTDRKTYSTFETQKRADNLMGIDPGVLKAVFLFFENVKEYLVHLSPYRLIFSGTETDNKKITLGISDTIYGLCKAGYGSKDEISNMGLSDYLNLLMKQIIDAVHTLRDMKKKDHEIADKLKLPIDIIIQI